MLLCINPLVTYFDNFLTDEECDHFINLGKERLEPATVLVNGVGVPHENRNNSYGFIKHKESEITEQVSVKLSRFCGIPPTLAEDFQVVHYDVNQEYKPHHDSFTPDEMKLQYPRGQRIFTGLVYLNTVEEGGATVFPKLNLEVQAVKGRVCFFGNTFFSTPQLHPLSEHGGAPVTKGEKWAMNLWYRDRPWQSYKL